MRLIKFIPEHAKELVYEDKLSIGTMRPEHDWEHHMEREALHDAWTGIENGHIIAAAGFIPMWNGVAECWFIGSDRIQRKLKTVVKTTLSIMEKMPYSRMHANVRANWKEAIPFAEFLGFEKEGVMKKFGPEGSDYLVMGRIKK